MPPRQLQAMEILLGVQHGGITPGEPCMLVRYPWLLGGRQGHAMW
jgi:hypothetical protein